MPSQTVLFSILAGIVAVTAAIIYLFGVPPEVKKQMEEKALETMGENKASYMMKGRYRDSSPTCCCTDCNQQIKSTRYQRQIRKT